MPRYRYSWTNLPEELLDRLAGDLGFAGDDPAAELRAYYGARPKPNFIQDAWPTLLDSWLANDDASRERIVDELSAAGLGEVTGHMRSKKVQLAYLESCRNAKSLRDIVLSAFLAAGEPAQHPVPTSPKRPAETSEQEPSEAEPPEEQPAPTQPDGEDEEPEDFDAWVDDTISEYLGVSVDRDPDGDLAVPHGSTIVYVRTREEDSPFVEISAHLLSGFKPSDDIFKAMNAINAQLPLAKTTVNSDGTVILMSAELFAEELTQQALVSTIELVGDAADHYDSLLKKRFGGHTRLDDTDDVVDI
ncbi:T3SS (YopN, CesT) and YbjN peptide-binding chaperone 1 [Gordonia rhizosphera]|uniref:TY-Chap central domain-containing protein n=1 Tax=Gordonia rhizosphera NBRC 16068 TaxID=1108045 RepID=K6WG16_9ACTN|nr:YbjN domain-containing protein [Gordonia rhizosphera]GAB92711.1 hypothetical protein GORHZ_188_00020 [Gordonia rhizosphera NBRC 16068]